MEKDFQPLVSVPVITYNSSKTVVETLDSIYNQTYPNLELIVSDDCSTDKTVEICRKWIDTHKGRFVRTELLTVEKNTGVSANMNRAEATCRGEWVKAIAGDDLLMPECIEEFVGFVNGNSEAKYVFSRVEVFGDNVEKVEKMSRFFKYEFFTDWNVEQQLGYLLSVDNCIPAMAAFYNVDYKKRLGILYDTRIPNLEDHTMWINLLRTGVVFYFVDKVLVRYRLSDTSLCTGTKYKLRFQQSMAARYVYYLYPTSKSIIGWRKADYKYLCARIIMGRNVVFWKVLRKVFKLFFGKP